MAQLSNGVRLPWLSYGTYKVPSGSMESLLSTALSAGYRGIDTAEGYKNEQAIGAALQILLPQYGLARQDVFITSKLAPRSQGLLACRAAVAASLKALRTSYIDLYLIHWPGGAGLEPRSSQHQSLRAESWRALEELHRQGVLRAIGVSNYNESHLQQLLDDSVIVPHVNQCECHPLFQHIKLRQLCQRHGVHFQAYSSLGTTAETNQLLTHPAVLQTAEALCRTPAQVLLRWALQQDVSVIPKSCNTRHIEHNFNVDFKLTDEQMNLLNSLDSDRRLAWDSSQVL